MALKNTFIIIFTYLICCNFFTSIVKAESLDSTELKSIYKTAEKLAFSNQPDTSFKLLSKNLPDTSSHQWQNYWRAKMLSLMGYNNMAKGFPVSEYLQYYIESNLISLQYIDIKKFTHIYIVSAINIGESYRAIGQFENAEEILLQAKSIANESYSTYPSLLNRLGAVYQEMGQGLKARNLQYESRNAAIKLGDTVMAVRIMTDIGYTFLNEESLNTDSAEWAFSDALHLYQSVEESIYPMLGLARAYQHANKHQLAIDTGFVALQLAEKAEIDAYVRDGYDLLQESYKKIGDWKNAFLTQNKYFEYFKDNFNKQNERFAEEIKAEYQVKKAELEKAKSDLIAQKEANAKRFFAFALIAALLLLGISVWMYFKTKRLNNSLKDRNQTIDNKNTQLQQLNREIYHRTKNHLQSMSSLLSLQKYQIHDQNARALMQENENRMHVMSLIHKRLFDQGAVEIIFLDDFIDELVSDLAFTYNMPSHFKSDLQIPKIAIAVDVMVSLSLTLNEALTNAFKYGLKTNNPYLIIKTSIDLDIITIEIADNGPGFSSLKHIEQSGTFGIELIKSMMKQIKGSVQFINNAGAIIRLQFPK